MSRRPRAAAVDAEEAAPEADRLEGFAHPRDTATLFGQQAAEQALAVALTSGRMHHAWLLTGLEGIGKATLAYRFARTALATTAEREQIPAGTLSVSADTIVAKQVHVLSHPGLMVIRRPWQRDTKRLASVITVDEVRRIKGFLQHSASQGAYRVVIIDRAEEMNTAAANAVLKSLEEPPQRTVFLLISSEPGRLLPTIQSRCRRLDLKPLAADDLLSALAAPLAAAGHDIPTADATRLVSALAEGSVRRALTLIAGGAVEQHGKLVGLLTALPQLDFEAVHKLAESVGAHGAEQDFQTCFTLLLGLLARALRAKATGKTPIAEEAHLFSRLFPADASGARLATWAELWETSLREKSEVLALNLDRKAFVIDTFHRIEAASRSAV